MGQACGGPASGRLPSSLRLCRDAAGGVPLSGNNGGAAATTATGSSSGSARNGMTPRPVFNYCSAEELMTLSDVIQEWARGRLSGLDARRQLHMSVFSASQASNSSGAGSGRAEEDSSRQAWPRSAATAAVATGESRRGRSNAQGMGNLFESTEYGPPINPGNVAMIISMPSAPGSRDISLVMLASAARTDAHPLFNFVDDVLVNSSSVEDGWGMVMREVGLDGRPLPMDVKVRFRELLDEILNGRMIREGQNPPSTSHSTTRLEVLKLCMCMEVLRHVCPPSGGLAAVPPSAPPVMLGLSHSRGSAHLVSTRMPSSAPSMLGRLLQDGAPQSGMRFDQAMLQVRIIAMLESAFENSPGMEPLHQGLEPREIQQHCPLVTAESELRALGDDICCVCLDHMATAQELRRLPCGHILHKSCCEEWLARANTCPACRSSVLNRSNTHVF